MPEAPRLAPIAESSRMEALQGTWNVAEKKMAREMQTKRAIGVSGWTT